TVKATAPGLREGRCAVEVFIGEREVAGAGERDPSDDHRGLISARRYLLFNQGERSRGEETDFGLYSYLLFSEPPRNKEEETRYLKTIESLLALGEVEEFLERHVESNQLNITYIPVTRLPESGKSYAESAATVLRWYDYRTAEKLLNQLDKTY